MYSVVYFNDNFAFTCSNFIHNNNNYYYYRLFLEEYIYIYACVCVCVYIYIYIYMREMTIKFANSPTCACRGSTEQKP